MIYRWVRIGRCKVILHLLTLTSTVQPDPPTRSVARTALCRRISIVSSRLRSGGRSESLRESNSASHGLLTRTLSKRGKKASGISLEVILCWNSTDGSSGSMVPSSPSPLVLIALYSLPSELSWFGSFLLSSVTSPLIWFSVPVRIDLSIIGSLLILPEYLG